MSSQNFSAAGAVDLSALAARNKQPAGGQGSPDGNGYVIDLTEQDLAATVQRLADVPIVLDFWADWCQPCKQLSPILERLANEYAGRFVLAKVDVDANQQLAQQAQIQSIPTVAGLLRGQLVQLFMGAYPEEQVREVIDKFLEAAVQQGVTGTAEPAADAQAQEETEAAVPPKYAAADEALGRGDIDGAIAAYEQALAETPGDEIATAGLARAQLLKRTTGLDVAQVRDEAATRPDDVQVQCRAADLEVSGGHVDDAFNRLIQAVKRLSGDDRNAVREHLIELFSAVGLKDPRVAKARRDLASALF